MKATLIVVQKDADYAEAKALIERLMNSSDPADQARMAEAYERSRWPRRAARVPELLTYLMDQHGLTRADLVLLLGTASRVSEVLNGKRELSMSMIRKVRDRFRVPADLLIPQAHSHGMAAWLALYATPGRPAAAPPWSASRSYLLRLGQDFSGHRAPVTGCSR